MSDIAFSGADLSASVDTSAAEATMAAELATEGDAPEDTVDAPDAPEETDEPAEPEAPEAPEEDAPEDAAPEAPAEEQPPAEELPPGVTTKTTAEGKKKYYLPEPVYKDFQGAAELRGKLVDILGEDATPEAVELRQRAWLGQERLYADLLSGDADSQGRVIQHFLEESREAVRAGEVGSDPMVSFSTALYETLAKQHPEAHAQILRSASRKTLDDIYEAAAEAMAGAPIEEVEAAAKAGDRSAQRALNLLYSAQHLDRELFKSYRKATDLKARAADPLAEREAQLRAREEELKNRDATASRERWTAWQTNTRTSVTSAISTEIDTALAEAKKQYAKFPNALQNVTDRLKAKVNEAIKGDARWRELIALQTNKAQRAASEQVRQQLAEDIVRRHANKARAIVVANKDAILRETVGGLKAQSDATHQRRATGAQLRAPGGGGTPVKRSLAPVPGSDYEVASVENLMRDLDRLQMPR